MSKIHKPRMRISLLLLVGLLALSLLTSSVSQMFLFSGVAQAATTPGLSGGGVNPAISTIVGNTPPTAPVVDVRPNSPKTNDNLSCIITTPSTDNDSDTITYTYRWYMNNDLQPDETTVTTELTDTLSSALTTRWELWKCVVTPNDGFADGDSDSDEVIIGNTAPTAPAVDVTPNSPLTTDDLVCTVTTPSTDADGDTITYTYKWYKNNILQTDETTATTELSYTLSSTFTARWEIWKCVVTPDDSITTGISRSDQVTIGNTAPMAPVVDVTPDSPLTTNDLVCTITTPSTDADGDTITYNYQWYKNNDLQPDETTATTELTDTLSSTLTARGETWKCVVIPYDGGANGPTAQDEVTIGNTAPTAPVIDVTPNGPLTTDDLVCTVTAASTDADGDTITYTYKWYKDNVLQPDETTTTAELTDTLSSALTANGETWICVVTPNDGTINGLSAQDEVTVGNNPPTAPVVDVTPNSPEMGDDLVCTITTPSTDADGDTITYFYEWYKNDVLQPDETTTTAELTDTLSSALTANGETWICEVTPYDGSTHGISDYDQVTIGNTAPTAPVVDVTPDNPLTSDNLLCTINAASTDVNGDTITYTYEWYKDNVLQPGETTATTDLTDTLSSALTANGETWRCEVTPNDGTANGISDSDEVTIGNTAPTAPVVNVTPNLPVTDDDLICTVTTESTDEDGDITTYTYEWYKDDAVQIDETTITTALTNTLSSALTAIGETWKCVVTPNDGTVDGPSAEDQVTIVATSKTETITNGTLDAIVEADTEVIVDGSAIVTVAEYADNPAIGFNGDIAKYIDVYIGDVTAVNEVEIRLYYTDGEINGKDESSLKLTWWDGSAWAECSDSGVNTAAINSYSGYIWAKIRNDTTPSLNDLSGTPFGATAAEKQPPSSGGGGGGGGGGGASGVTSLVEYMTGAGIFVEDVTAESADGKVKLYIPKGTTGKNRTGRRLPSISIKPSATTPVPPDNNKIVCLTYDIGPISATFDPSIYLTFKYSDSDIPAGVAEKNLVIGTWQDGKWIKFEGCIVDTVNNTITVPISHFTVFTVMANTAPASFEVTGMTVTPAEVYPNETVTVSATVTNTGGMTGSYGVTLKINNLALQTTNVNLDGGDSQTISFRVTPDTTGGYTAEVNGLSSRFSVREPVPEEVVTEEPVPTPASFTISDLSVTPGEVNPLEEVTVSAVVANIGGSDGSYTVILKINDREEDRKEISLNPGKNERLFFSVTRYTAGNHTIDINGHVGQFTVKSNPADEALPIPPSTNWWLLGGIIASAVIIVGIAIFLFKRLSDTMKSPATQ